MSSHYRSSISSMTPRSNAKRQRLGCGSSSRRKFCFLAECFSAIPPIVIAFGGINTAVLLISSTVMAFAVRAAGKNRRALLGLLLLGTAALGALFLIIKGFEYAQEIHEHLLPGSLFHIDAADPTHAELFFYIYWLMTGVHALHVTIGIVLIAFFAFRAWFTNAFRNHDTPVELLGLYWHFVDIVWVFLFPLIYMIDRHS